MVGFDGRVGFLKVAAGVLFDIRLGVIPLVQRMDDTDHSACCAYIDMECAGTVNLA